MYKNKRILAVIPARGGSKGIKLKNLREIQGIPLVGLAGIFVKDFKIFDKAIVSTDHLQIAKIAINFGLEAPFMRPKKISGDLNSDLEVLSHALMQTEYQDGCIYDIIVMLQPTSPLRQAHQVLNCINQLIDYNFDSVWTISKNDSKNHPLKQIVCQGNKIKLYDKLGENIIARQQLKPLYYRNGIAYVFTRDCLIKHKKLMTENTGKVLIEEPSISIDTEWDLELAEFLMTKRKV